MLISTCDHVFPHPRQYRRLCDPFRGGWLPFDQRHAASRHAFGLSHAEAKLCLKFQPSGIIDDGLSGHGLDPSTLNRPFHRQKAPALYLAIRPGVHGAWPHPIGDRTFLPSIAHRRRLHRHRFIDLPPRRLARIRLASGGQYGMAQSLFQVGGNIGTSIGPLLAAGIVLQRGQTSLAWFAGLAAISIIILSGVGRWYSTHLTQKKSGETILQFGLDQRTVKISLAILVALMFSKFVYMACMHSFYTFYLIDKFGVSTQAAQLYLFVLLGAVAVGTFAGGPIGDRIGRKSVIWFSILGTLPFSLALPHLNLFWTVACTIPIGLILSSAFSAMVVYAQELMPGRVGMISGLFFGLAFGSGGLGAAVLGVIADHTTLQFIFELCSILPAIGLLAFYLPSTEQLKSKA